jgi:hypothetical protein
MEGLHGRAIRSDLDTFLHTLDRAFADADVTGGKAGHEEGRKGDLRKILYQVLVHIQ